MTVIQVFFHCPHPYHILTLWQQALHHTPESIVSSYLGNHDNHRHELSQPPGQLLLRVFDTPPILSNTQPRHMDALGKFLFLIPLDKSQQFTKNLITLL